MIQQERFLKIIEYLKEHQTATLNEIDCIVTDTHTGDDVIRKYEEANVNVIRAGKR